MTSLCHSGSRARKWRAAYVGLLAPPVSLGALTLASALAGGWKESNALRLDNRA